MHTIPQKDEGSVSVPKGIHVYQGCTLWNQIYSNLFRVPQLWSPWSPVQTLDLLPLDDVCKAKHSDCLESSYTYGQDLA